MSDEERKRNKIILCFLHMVVAVPTFLQSLWCGWSGGKWREGMFHDESRFTSMVSLCIVLRPLSAGGGRNAREDFPNGID